jgi:regulator of sigma E protease
MDQLIPSFGSLGLTLVAFIVALSVIVAIHEYGHYIVGRWSGIKADVFSIGYGPVLWSRMDRHGTKWQIAALPLGGFVKFHGDANAASGKADEEAMAEMDAAEKRHTLHGAPLWARAATVAAGPVFNFVLSIAIFTGFVYYQGIASNPLTVGSSPEIPGYEDLAVGDEIVSLEGVAVTPVEQLGDFLAALPDKTPMEWKLRRGGEEVVFEMAHPLAPLVSSVNLNTAAYDAGFQSGDLILELDGEPVSTFEALSEKVLSGEGATVQIKYWRAGEVHETSLTPRWSDVPTRDGGFESRWLLGFSGGSFVFTPATRSPSFGEAVSAGWNQTGYVITSSVSGLYHMIAGRIDRCNLRGAIGIAETSGYAVRQGLDTFIWFIAVLSTAIGLLNLFPIPVLDGGHLVFHAWEAISGKPPSDAVLNVLMTIGLVVVLSLMVFGLSNDIFCP